MVGQRSQKNSKKDPQKDRDRLRAIQIICFFGIFAFIISIILSQEVAEFGLLVMPALSHLYPIVVLSFIIIYSIITSRRILWFPLFLLLGGGLLLECLLFQIIRLFIFESQKVMALFIFGQLVLLYGLTFFLYFYFNFRIPPENI